MVGNACIVIVLAILSAFVKVKKVRAVLPSVSVGVQSYFRLIIISCGFIVALHSVDGRARVLASILLVGLTRYGYLTQPHSLRGTLTGVYRYGTVSWVSGHEDSNYAYYDAYRGPGYTWGGLLDIAYAVCAGLVCDVIPVDRTACGTKAVMHLIILGSYVL
jgi:hypothetical protein